MAVSPALIRSYHRNVESRFAELGPPRSQKRGIKKKERQLMRTLILFAALVVLASGCGAMMAPVLDIQNAPVTTPAGVTPSIGRTREVILRGLADRGWTIDREEGQTIIASVTAGGHQATVGIDYSADTYSIQYVASSPGLRYDGLEIHKRYNHWVDRLRASINKELARSHGQAPAAPAPTPTEPAPAPAPAPAAPAPAPAAPAPAAPAPDTAMPPAPPPP